MSSPCSPPLLPASREAHGRGGPGGGKPPENPRGVTTASFTQGFPIIRQTCQSAKPPGYLVRGSSRRAGGLEETERGKLEDNPSFRESALLDPPLPIVSPSTQDSNSGSPASGRPTGRPTANRRPSAGWPSVGRLSAGRPPVGRPPVGRPSPGRPAGGRPADGRPAALGRPASGRPADGRPTDRDPRGRSRSL
jgi:hypothetical protein